jgi:hypothetical protein
MIQTARRLDIIEEYYFSSKLREVRQLLKDRLSIWELEAQTYPSQSVIDAVKLALEDENAHQYQSYQVARIAKSMADFYLNNMR